MIFGQAVDRKREQHQTIGKFDGELLQKSLDPVRQAAVRRDENRSDVGVAKVAAGDIEKLAARKRLAAGEVDVTQAGTECLGEPVDLLHRQLVADRLGILKVDEAEGAARVTAVGDEMDQANRVAPSEMNVRDQRKALGCI